MWGVKNRERKKEKRKKKESRYHSNRERDMLGCRVNNVCHVPGHVLHHIRVHNLLCSLAYAYTVQDTYTKYTNTYDTSVDPWKRNIAALVTIIYF